MLYHPEKKPKQTWMEWATARFGEKAAPYAVKALEPTDDIIMKTLYCKKCYFGSHHSSVPEFEYLPKHLRSHQVGDMNPDLAIPERELLNPDDETLAWVLKEKDEALALCQASLSFLAEGKQYFKKEDYDWLREYMEMELDAIKLFRLINESYFLYTLGDRAKKRKIKKEYFIRLKQCLNDFEIFSDYFEQKYGPDFIMGSPNSGRAVAPIRIKEWIARLREWSD